MRRQQAQPGASQLNLPWLPLTCDRDAAVAASRDRDDVFAELAG